MRQPLENTIGRRYQSLIEDWRSNVVTHITSSDDTDRLASMLYILQGYLLTLLDVRALVLDRDNGTRGGPNT